MYKVLTIIIGVLLFISLIIFGIMQIHTNQYSSEPTENYITGNTDTYNTENIDKVAGASQKSLDNQENNIDTNDSITEEYDNLERNSDQIINNSNDIPKEIKSDDNSIESIEKEEYIAPTNNSENMNEDVKVEIDQSTLTNTGVTIIITDNHSPHYGWGFEYTIQTKINNEWEDVTPIRDLTTIALGAVLDENNQFRHKINWEDDYGILPSGIYRIVKPERDINGFVNFYSNEFTIE